MKKERVYAVNGTEYDDKSILVCPDLDSAFDFIREEVESLPEGEEKDYTLQILMMTPKEVDELSEFDG